MSKEYVAAGQLPVERRSAERLAEDREIEAVVTNFATTVDPLQTFEQGARSGRLNELEHVYSGLEGAAYGLARVLRERDLDSKDVFAKVSELLFLLGACSTAKNATIKQKPTQI